MIERRRFSPEPRQDNADVQGAMVLRERVCTARVARLATIDPHLVPIVFVLDGQTLYSASTPS
jgi:nitroimidazol reductase NimA-like FMN-containing flavoprotein (pyridoxamine 5'-phosphate oxidase superfamily)